ncbi:hypothetical protein BC829DRAFT_409662 [Chytridium lagenaria]|nr:hypothetical protein BC829DRAFT_409662 [Chytridium lagenaria]
MRAMRTERGLTLSMVGVFDDGEGLETAVAFRKTSPSSRMVVKRRSLNLQL